MSRYDWLVRGVAGSAQKRMALLVVAVTVWLVAPSPGLAADAHWIWAPGVERDAVGQSDCFFRRSFNVEGVEAAELTITANDSYEFFLNGRRVGSGNSPDRSTRYDILKYLLNGRNVLAVKVTNEEGSTAGLAVNADFRLPGGRKGYLVTDKSWLTQDRPLPLWYLRLYRDQGWSEAQSFGKHGRPQLAQRPAPTPAAETVVEPPRETPEPAGAPAATEPDVVRAPTPALPIPDRGVPAPIPETVVAESRAPSAPENPQTSEQDKIAEAHGDFTLNEGFAIELVMDRERTGSVIAITFNEFGEILCSREDGPLLIVSDTDSDRVPDKVRVWCDKVKNCQGLLALNGDVFAVGDGPQGAALYRISDSDADGTGDKIRAILQFKDEIGEHGPHGVVLGPDGLLYIASGNYGAPVKSYTGNSPYRETYEGDLVQPRLEDSFQHAAGVKAPGGVVMRTDIDGKFVEAVAGGLRNAYDLAFNKQGELFTSDNDMQWDVGLPWHRPPRLLLVCDGAEFGWRSGWAKWPDYFVDSLPGIDSTDAGAPTGMVFYEHVMFPKRYQGALFQGDWQRGRILAVTLRREGASYTTNTEVFAEGSPMHVTDIEVGPDGWLYFATGGRGTPGGLYRIVWEGEVPEKLRDFGTGMTAAIRQPQLHSAWCRQRIADQLVQLKEKWGTQLVGVASTDKNPPEYRIRALDLMQLYGPTPSADLLVQLSREESPDLRAKTASLMGIHPSDKTRQRLVELLEDEDPFVRRKACEALIQAGSATWSGKLSEMLASTDRFEAWAARRMLERIDPAKWDAPALSSGNRRIFIQAATALLIVKPDKETALKVTARISQLLRGYVSDADFIDLLRVTQLALLRGGLIAEDVPELCTQLAGEFPSSNLTMNRELVRLLVHLQVAGINDRYMARLEADIPDVQRLHLGMYLSRLTAGWSTPQKLKLMRFYDRSIAPDGGRSYRGYILRVAQDFAAGLSNDEKLFLLAEGEQHPTAAFAVLSKMPEQLDAEAVAAIKQLDQRVAAADGEAVKRLKVAVVAVLARSGDEDSIHYLREIFDREPERRNVVALGLAQMPGDEQWDYLARSLPALEGVAAVTVVRKLADSDRVADKPGVFRDLIELGLTLDQSGREDVVKLLEKWSGEKVEPQAETPENSLAAWQKWLAGKFPNHGSLAPIPADEEQPPAEVARKPGKAATN